MPGQKVRPVYGLPNNGATWSEDDIKRARYSNKFAIKGLTGLKSPEFGNDDASLFLEFVTASGVFTIKDKNGNNILTGLPTVYDVGHSPIRLDGGFELTGATFTSVIGFILIRF
jgi:hypothetical protein